MLRRSYLRATVLALLQLLPAGRRARVQQQLLRLKNRLRPQTAAQMAVIKASGLWDESWFLSQHPQFADSRQPLKTFVRLGGKQPLCPHPLFDSAWYQAHNPDVTALGINPLYHYLLSGHREGRQPNALFNDHWYRDRNPDVSDFAATALQHYLQFGDAESRDAHPLLQTRWYRDQHADLGAHTTVLAHYLHAGEHAGARPNAWFDPQYYRDQADMAQHSCLLAHFVSHGATAGLNPSADFCVHEYCEAHPQVADSGINPLVHFLSSGRKRQTGGRPTPLQPSQWHALFGKLSAFEHGLLAPHAPEHRRVLVWHAPHQQPTITPSEQARPNLSYCFKAWNQSVDWAAFDAVVWTQAQQSIYEDAVLLGLVWLNTQPMQPVYFDDLCLQENQAVALDFKPDWSPARYRRGRLQIPLLMLTPQFLSANGASGEQLQGRLLESWKPAHIPFIASQRQQSSASALPPQNRPVRQPLVSIIIPTRDQLPFLRKCMDGLCQITRYPHWEVILMDNGSQQTETLDYLDQLAAQPNITIKRWDKPFNYSQLCNVGAEIARGEWLCLLNNDIEITQPDWLDKLVEAGLEDGCGAVGAMLNYPDGSIQSAGVLMGPGGVAANRYATQAADTIPAGILDHVHEVSAVAGACLLTPKAVYEQLQGLNESQLGVAFNDVDYCLRLREQGLYCRLEPTVQLIHHESISLKDHAHGRGQAFADEVRWMQQRWADVIARDPFHNLNLTLSKFRPWAAFAGNRRALLWPLLGIDPPATPSPEQLHAPLRWYADDNQSRVQAVTQARRAVTFDRPAIRRGLAILILTKDRPEYIIPLLRDLTASEAAFRQRQLELRIFIGDTGSSDPAVLSAYRSLPDCCELVSGLSYQFSRCNNHLLQAAQDFETVLFLNNDIAFGTASASLLQLYDAVHAHPACAIAGAVLQFADGSTQHQGIDALAETALRGLPYHPGAHGPVQLAPHQQRHCLAVTGALLMMRADALRVTGGFDEAYAAECQDVDLCLTAARAGYQSVVINVGRIIHYENGTRPRGEENWRDRRRLMRRWSSWVEAYWL